MRARIIRCCHPSQPRLVVVPGRISLVRNGLSFHNILLNCAFSVRLILEAVRFAAFLAFIKRILMVYCNVFHLSIAFPGKCKACYDCMKTPLKRWLVPRVTLRHHMIVLRCWLPATKQIISVPIMYLQVHYRCNPTPSYYRGKTRKHCIQVAQHFAESFFSDRRELQ